MAERIDIVISSRGLEAAEQALDRIARSARQGHVEVERLESSLRQAGQAGQGLGTLSTQMGRAAQSGRSLSTQMAGVSRASRSATSAQLGLVAALGRTRSRAVSAASGVVGLNRSMRATRTAALGAAQSMRSYLSAFLLLGATGGIFRQVDGFQNLENQLRATTRNQSELNDVVSDMFGIANRARVPVGSLAKTYRRIDFAIKNLGGTQRESARITETISKLLTLSGSTAEEAASSMLQLSQAFNKGKLDGDEFRSVAELMPEAIQEISKILKRDLGSNFTNIFDASEKGLITVEVMRRAFASLANEVDARMRNLPRTIGQAWSQLTNTITQQFGELDRSLGITRAIGAAFDFIGQNLSQVTRLVVSFVIAFVGLTTVVPLLLAILNPMYAITGALVAAATAVIYFSDQFKVGENKIASLQDVTLEFLRRLPGYFTQIYSAIAPAFSSALKTAENFFNSVTGMNSQLLTHIANGDWEGAFQSMVNAYGVVRDTIISVIAAAQTMTTVFSNAFTSITSFIRAMVNAFLVGINTMVQIATTGFRAIALSAINAFRQIPEIVRNRFGVTNQVLAQAEAAVNSFGTTSIQNSTVVRAAIAGMNAAFNQYGQNIKIGLNAVAADYQANYARIRANVINEEQNILRAAERSAVSRQQLNGTLTQNLQQIWRSHGQILSQDWARVQQQITQLTTQSGQQNQQTWANMWQNMQSITQTAAQAIMQIISQISNAISAAAQRIASLAGSAGSIGSSVASALGNSVSVGGGIGGLVGGPAGASIGGAVSAGFGDFSGFNAQFRGFQLELQRTQLAAEAAKQPVAGIQADIASAGNAAATAASQLSNLSSSLGANGGTTAVGDVGSTGIGGGGLGSATTRASEGLDNFTNSANRASDATGSLKDRGASNFRSLGNSVEQFSNRSQNALQSVFSNVQSAISNFVRTGKFDFKELMRSIVDDLLKLVTSRLFSQFLGLFGGGGGGGGLLGGIGGFGGGLFGGGLLGFQSGGYTGNGPVNRVAGVVHGKEYVMNASATRRHRPLLEAMNSGSRIGVATAPSSGGSSKQKVTIHNYAGVQVETKQRSDEELEVMIRRVSGDEIGRRTPKLVAGEIANANSRIGKQIQRSTTAERRR